MSVSIKPFCRKERINQDHTVIIQLCVAINRKRRWVSTGIRVLESEWDFEKQELKTDNPTIKHLLYKHIESLNKQIKRLEVFDMAITLDNILPKNRKLPNCTIAEYFMGDIEQLERVGKIGSASKRRLTLSLLNKAQLSNMRFDELNSTCLYRFESYLNNRGNCANSIATKFSILKAVYNKALKDGVFVCRENPFASYKPTYRCVSTRKRAIRKEDVMALMETPLPETNSPYTELARDLFLFSYFSAGINFKDIALLRCCDVVSGRIHYRRRKTGKEMNCRLMPQAQSIIDKYMAAGKYGEDYIFPILDRAVHKTEIQIANRLHKVLAHINRELKNWGTHLGLPTKLTTYVARHTFATVLKRSGVNIAIISESLGHSDLSTTQIYLDSFENAQIDEAMKNLV